jgi:hypothetical protein
MGKRSDFARVERDFYPTPREAVLPLVPHLWTHEKYVEPCAGDGSLIGWLNTFGFQCRYASDIEPRADGIQLRDALGGGWMNHLYITNPPWDRKILHPLIESLTYHGGRAWLLFDADWVHTRQSVPYLPRLRKIVSVGRVKWIPDSKMTGKDNCAWHYFTAPSDEPIQFYGRTA